MHLILGTADHFEKLMESPAIFEATYHLKVMEGYLEFPEVLPIFRQWLLENPKKVHKWWAYLVVDDRKERLIGSVGYRGVPQNGVVEIGCGIARAYRGRGLATQATQQLIKKAFRHKHVHTVIAHSLPEKNASATILERCGFIYIGQVTDPEDGVVWRWERYK
jgi:[ribosomal protein S5]-alanine N-acetyltransferase